MSTCTSPWWRGLTCDHLYADCPARMGGEGELRRAGWWERSEVQPTIDPHGGEVCGLCLRRHERAEHAGVRV